ncbi:MAG: hypothetical protein JNG84_15475 [Archangium sp.]|nr:hypothetical protein [Archangium sp.]
MRRRLVTLFAVAAFVAGAGACFDATSELTPTFRFRCAEPTDCRPGYVCFEEECVPPELAVPRDGGAGGGAEETSDAGEGSGGGAGNESGIPSLPIETQGPVCAPSGWCWVSPQPRGFSQCSVALAAPGVGFAVLDGQLFRVTATRALEYIELNATAPLGSVVATSASSGVVTQQNGTSIHFAQSQNAFARAMPDAGVRVTAQLVASAAGDVWAYTTETLLRFNASASRWERVALPPGLSRIRDVAVTSADEAYVNLPAPDYRTDFLHRYLTDGGWTCINDGGIGCLSGNTPTGIYAAGVGGNATIARVSATGVQPVATVNNSSISSLCILSESNRDLFGYATDGVWAYLAGQWERQVPPRLEPSIEISSMSMLGREGIACAPNSLFMTVGSIWHSAVALTTSNGSRPQPRRLTVRDDGAAYGFGSGSWLLTQRGAEPVSALSQVDIMGRVGPGDYVVIRDSQPRRFDGATVGQAMPGGAALASSHFEALDVAASGPSDIWLAGRINFNTAGVAHWDGASWTVVPPPAGTIERVAEIEAAGGTTWAQRGGRVFRYENGSWVDLGQPTPGFFADSLAAISPTEVLVAGTSSVVRWSSTTGWQPESTIGATHLAADPEAHTAMMYTSDFRLLWRQSAGVWSEITLPGVLTSMSSTNLALGIFGQRAWAASQTGSIFTKQ